MQLTSKIGLDFFLFKDSTADATTNADSNEGVIMPGVNYPTHSFEFDINLDVCLSMDYILYSQPFRTVVLKVREYCKFGAYFI